MSKHTKRIHYHVFITMKISVIIPTYHPQAYIQDCFQSLACQTLERSQFEVLVVLNGSAEPYQNQLRQWIGDILSGVSVTLLTVKKAGVSHARNVGIEHAHGQYITFIDDDDWLSPAYLETLLKTREETDERVMLMVKVNSYRDKEQVDDYLYVAYVKYFGRQLSIYKGRMFFSTVWGKLLPTNLLRSERFNEEFALCEDCLYMTNLSKYYDTVALVPENAVYCRRLRANSASRSKRSFGQRFRHSFSLMCAYLKMYFSCWRHFKRFRLFLSRVVAAWVWMTK